MSKQGLWRAESLPSLSGRTADEVLRALMRSAEAQYRSLRELERYLGSLHRDVYFGPVAGSYLSTQLGRSNDPGTALPTGTVDGSFFDFEMRPIHVSLIVFGGSATVDILSESSSILSAGAVALTAATQQTFNARGDFAVEKVTNDLSLSIVSIDAGTPIHVRAVVLSKNVSKVEPA